MLADLLKKEQPKGDVLSPIRDLNTFLSKRVDNRADGWHPSQLYDMCPRAEMIKRLDGIENYIALNLSNIADVTENNPESMRHAVMFDVGNAVHYWIQNRYFGPMGVLKGAWKCLKCGNRIWGFWARECQNCGGVHTLEFKEIPIHDPIHNIVGHSDGIYVPKWAKSEDDEAVIDIKTAGPHWWKTKYIDKKYVYQIMIYTGLMGLKKAILFFVDKASTEPCPFYEHIMDYDPVPLKDAREKIEIFNAYAGKKEFPMRCAECEIPGNQKCKKCPVSHVCMTDSIMDKIQDSWKNNRLEIK